MNHRLKSLVFKLLQQLPTKWGDYIYHRFQNAIAKSIEAEYTSQMDTVNRFVKLAAEQGFAFAGKRVVEIGSGWLPVLPYELVFDHQAAEVLTFDINAHFQAGRIREYNRFISSRKGISLPNHLPRSVRYFPQTNILEMADLSDLDVLVSRNVLEHVSPADLKSIHQQAYSYLKHGGFVIHQISPSDHRAYSDHSLSLWDFLRYSQGMWDSIQTRFDYHNRWRLPQYIDMFKHCGFRVRYLSYKSARPGQKLPERIHEDFRIFSEEELTAGNIMVVLDKG
ncbi:MAG: methyltransferase domain-containing protein [Cyclobacteriaceae bacterium]|nr:methyltransferase domain-containing protein [Cyclobacteriaceae bacterium]